MYGKFAESDLTCLKLFRFQQNVSWFLTDSTRCTASQFSSRHNKEFHKKYTRLRTPCS